ncbi:MAG: acyl carrier protein [Candidatus Electrothrix sp. GM3_4]|jgi:acyl carrier protein|nr:acyl carrier protein [Candidatus Electrothrix sp. GM3_4]
MIKSVIEQLKVIISEELDVNLKPEDIDENVSLFEEGLGFDSVIIVELIALTEEKFGIQFSDDELSLESFSNLNVLADCIIKKQGAS